MKTFSMRLLIPLMVFSLLMSCAKRSEQSGADTTVKAQSNSSTTKQGIGRGLVKSVGSSGRSVLLDHNDIPGIMEAMAMNYTVSRPEILNGVKVGDSVTFVLSEPSIGEYVVTEITPIKK